MSNLLVNEIFPACQGEGKSSGARVSFLRLSGCSLFCSWCDTPYTWNWIGTPFRHPEKFDKSKESHEYSVEEIKAKLDDLLVRRVVLSGGEPLLQQDKLIPLLKALKSDDYTIEVETNGTIKPSSEFLELIDQINCSPKTSNSGADNRQSMRERPEALKGLSASPKTSFKFVVDSEDDLVEILDLIKKYDMKEVYFMPQGRTRVEQLKNQDRVKEMALKHSFHFSPRLHVLEFDNKRGV